MYSCGAALERDTRSNIKIATLRLSATGQAPAFPASRRKNSSATTMAGFFHFWRHQISTGQIRPSNPTGDPLLIHKLICSHRCAHRRATVHPGALCIGTVPSNRDPTSNARQTLSAKVETNHHESERRAGRTGSTSGPPLLVSPTLEPQTPKIWLISCGSAGFRSGHGWYSSVPGFLLSILLG